MGNLRASNVCSLPDTGRVFPTQNILITLQAGNLSRIISAHCNFSCHFVRFDFFKLLKIIGGMVYDLLLSNEQIKRGHTYA